MLEVLRSGRLSLGPTIARFEELFAERVGTPYAAAVSSGTAGLHLLCHIAGFGSGDEVITSPISFVASANCFIVEGATPVFADVDPRDAQSRSGRGRGGDHSADDAGSSRSTCSGTRASSTSSAALCERHGLVLIEDACEALGAEYKGRPVGAHGVPAVFGFYPNKQITTGEGGVVVTHAEEEQRLLVSLRNQGRSYEGRDWFDHVRLGFNYRWTDLQAAIGIGQLEKLEEILELRAAAAARYGELVAELDGVRLSQRTTPTTAARGSSTSSSSPRGSIGSA